MVVKTITYTDYDNNERTEDFYFNLSQAEVAEMEMSTSGGLGETLRRIIAAQDMPALIENFKKVILKSYGVKAPDGKRFIKSEEMSIAFSQTEAYSQLFMLLATNADEAAKFINGIMPKESKQPQAAN